MAKMQDYTCRGCGKVYEYLLHGKNDTVTCPSCSSRDAAPIPGGRTFSVIVPMYPGAKKIKAGYIHSHGDRPREKISVSVPGKKGA